MTRRELREQTFKQLFLKEFYSEDEYAEQCSLYLEGLDSEGLIDMEGDEPVIREQLDPELKELLAERAARVYEKISELDEKINAVSQGWKTGRMGKVDVTILRLALFEILYDEEVPDKVAINEAVEIAKKYGGEDSSSFVNGVLGKLVRESQ